MCEEGADKVREECAAVSGDASVSPEMRAEAFTCLAVVVLEGAQVIGAVQPNGVIAPVYEGPQVGDADHLARPGHVLVRALAQLADRQLARFLLRLDGRVDDALFRYLLMPVRL